MSVNEQPNRADLGKDPARVSGMFDEVAAGYDRTNTVLSLGNDQLWRAATTRAVAPQRWQRILDLAAGTGASAVALARSGADVVAADFSPGMIAEGKRVSPVARMQELLIIMTARKIMPQYQIAM